jgi:hypothetical protein
MIAKIEEKKKAIELRKKGLSYSEILKQVPVTKASLSLWLRDIRLSKKQQDRLVKKSLSKLNLGAKIKKEKRILKTERIKKKAVKEIGKIRKRELWLIGIALYWAEGSKQKKHNVSQGVEFGNSDPEMIKFYLNWLKDCCGIASEDIVFYIYLHKTVDGEKVKKYWSQITELPLNRFQKIIWKKHKFKTIRKNIGKDYHGLLKITVKKSTDLNRKIAGLIEGIRKQV